MHSSSSRHGVVVREARRTLRDGTPPSRPVSQIQYFVQTSWVHSLAAYHVCTLVDRRRTHAWPLRPVLAFNRIRKVRGASALITCGHSATAIESPTFPGSLSHPSGPPAKTARKLQHICTGHLLGIAERERRVQKRWLLNMVEEEGRRNKRTGRTEKRRSERETREQRGGKRK